MDIKAIIVDDEPLALNLLKKQLSLINNVDIVETFNSFNLLENNELIHQIDVAFLDIEMPGLSGIALAEQMVEVNPHLLIVFVTAFNQYAVEAFEMNALDYLLKPVDQKRLQKTLSRIEGQITHRKPDTLPSNETLYVNLCRELKITTANSNQPLGKIRWRTQKTQELFIYLLYHMGETVPKPKLAELLWPDYNQERAFSQLYTAIYNIRRALVAYNNHFKIESVYEGYTLTGKNVVIDIIEWENRVKSLPPLTSTTIADYEAAMNLYTGPFLEIYEYSWSGPEQFRLGLLWLDFAKQIADFYKTENSIEKAIMWYEKICDFLPEDEHANLSIMKLHASLGYGILVDYQYSQYKRATEELQLPIDTEIKKWYDTYNERK